LRRVVGSIKEATQIDELRYQERKATPIEPEHPVAVRVLFPFLEIRKALK
jgi:hypothetical protein